ncbi:MAG: hypothetical protein MZV70_13015 [Desulfobacterales bacterium]|nr:hypothetical protein [Desulfobacterales bacterium]
MEVGEKIFSNADEVKVLQNMERRIVKDIKDYLGVSAKVKLVEPKTLQRFEGKASRVMDKRQIDLTSLRATGRYKGVYR